LAPLLAPAGSVPAAALARIVVRGCAGEDRTGDEFAVSREAVDDRGAVCGRAIGRAGADGRLGLGERLGLVGESSIGVRATANGADDTAASAGAAVSCAGAADTNAPRP
jgi:hypothetical protein